MLMFRNIIIGAGDILILRFLMCINNCSVGKLHQCALLVELFEKMIFSFYRSAYSVR